MAATSVAPMPDSLWSSSAAEITWALALKKASTSTFCGASTSSLVHMSRASMEMRLATSPAA